MESSFDYDDILCKESSFTSLTTSSALSMGHEDSYFDKHEDSYVTEDECDQSTASEADTSTHVPDGPASDAQSRSDINADGDDSEPCEEQEDRLVEPTDLSAPPASTGLTAWTAAPIDTQIDALLNETATDEDSDEAAEGDLDTTLTEETAEVGEDEADHNNEDTCDSSSADPVKTPTTALGASWAHESGLGSPPHVVDGAHLQELVLERVPLVTTKSPAVKSAFEPKPEADKVAPKPRRNIRRAFAPIAATKDTNSNCDEQHGSTRKKKGKEGIREGLLKLPAHKRQGGYKGIQETLREIETKVPERYHTATHSKDVSEDTTAPAMTAYEKQEMKKLKVLQEEAAKTLKKSISKFPHAQHRPAKTETKTTEMLHQEQWQQEKKAFESQRTAMLQKMQLDHVQPRLLEGVYKNKQAILSYEEKQAIELAKIRKKKEAELKKRNETIRDKLELIFECSEGVIGVKCVPVKSPTIPQTPEVMRRSKRRMELKELSRQEEEDLLALAAQKAKKSRSKLSKEIVGSSTTLYVDPRGTIQQKAELKRKHEDAFLKKKRKFKAKPFQNAPTKTAGVGVAHKRKATSFKPFSRATLYTNPRQKRIEESKALHAREEKILQQKRRFRARAINEGISAKKSARRNAHFVHRAEVTVPKPFSRATIYQNPKAKYTSNDAFDEKEERQKREFKARAVPAVRPFRVKHKKTHIVIEPFDLEGVKRAEESKKAAERREKAEKAEAAKKNKKAPLGQLTNNARLDPHLALARKQEAIERAKGEAQADAVAKLEQEKLLDQQIAAAQKEYRKELNKLHFRIDVPQYPGTPPRIQSAKALVEPATPDVMRPIVQRKAAITLPKYLAGGHQHQHNDE